MSPVQALSMFRFSMQLALFESIQTLLRDDRAPEALVLTHGLIRNTCLLQLSATDEHGPGVAIQARLDALDRLVGLYDEPAVAEQADRDREALERIASAVGVDLPYVMPDLNAAPFFADYAKDAALVSEIALADVAAIQLHLEMEDDIPAFRTKSNDPQLHAGAASLAVSALTHSAVALGEICRHAYDQDLAAELLALAETLDPDRRSEDDEASTQ